MINSQKLEEAFIATQALTASLNALRDTLLVTDELRKNYNEKYKEQRDILTKQAKFYRAMALKKIGSAIKIPKRHFLGKSPKLEAELKKLITKHLSGIIKH